MIKTSSEGTSYCTRCESWAKENEELKRLLAHERDEFEKRETELMKENAELTIQAERIFPVKDIADKLAHDNLRLSFRNEKLEAVARAAEYFDKEWWFQPGPGKGCCGLCEAGLLPQFQDYHEPGCAVQLIHDALKSLREAKP